MIAAPIAPEELRLRSHDGLALIGSSWRPSAPPRAVLVLVHGLKDHTQRYGALASRANSLGVAVYGFDLRGHGRSEGPRAWIRRFEEYLLDLDLVRQEVARRHPGLPEFLFGHSMGGAIVVRYALERAPSVRGVVLSAPALRPPVGVSAGAVTITRLLGTIAPRAAIFRLPNTSFSRDSAVVEAMGADPLISAGPAPARTAAELLRTMRWIRARDAGFSASVLALHGTADRLTHPEGSRRFIATAASSSKELRAYPELYHDLLHEPERATVLGDIADWLGARLV